MNICDYGCGQEAKYQFKNGKWCCSSHYEKCPAQKNKRKGKNHSEETKQKMRGEKNSMYGKKHTEETKQKMSKSHKGKNHSEETKQKLRENMKGKKNPMYGKRLSKEHKEKIGEGNKGKKFTAEHREKMSKSHKRTIEQLKEKYPIFYKEEKLRYNPDKPKEKEIQVHCKNHDCENSKEKGGWFTPSGRQLEWRIGSLEKSHGFGESNFYCCQQCKDECILYRLRSDPFKEITDLFTQEEYNIWHQTVLEQDNYECQKCESKENLHCHHIQPVKTHPHLALDPSNGIVLCKKCHYEIGHKTGTECSTGNLANINQSGCNLGS